MGEVITATITTTPTNTNPTSLSYSFPILKLPPPRGTTGMMGTLELKDRITPHVTNFFRLRLTIEKQEGKRKYKSDGAVMVGEFVCMYVCSCTVSE